MGRIVQIDPDLVTVCTRSPGEIRSHENALRRAKAFLAHSRRLYKLNLISQYRRNDYVQGCKGQTHTLGLPASPSIDNITQCLDLSE